MKGKLVTSLAAAVKASSPKNLRISLDSPSPAISSPSDPNFGATHDIHPVATTTIRSDSEKIAAVQQLKPLRRPKIEPEQSLFAANVAPICAWRSTDFEFRYHLQPYTPHAKTDSCPLYASALEKQFNVNTDTSAVLIYLPICLDEDIYSNPEQFEDYLKAIVTAFKPRPVHIALSLPDELNRHQLYKEKYMHDPHFFGSKRKSSKPDLDATDDCRDEAKQQGDNWLKVHSIDTLASKLGCKITLFRWGELVTPNMTFCSLKNIFIHKMKIEAKKNQINFDVNICDLIGHIRAQYNSGIGFATAVRPKLNEVSNKDISRFHEKTNVGVSDRSNKTYLFEEVAHTMQVFATGLFDVTFQAQIFHRRKFTHKPGASLFGEILYHWTCEMLNSYLEAQNSNSQTSEKPSQLIMPHYITVGRYPAPGCKNLVVKPTNSKNKLSNPKKINTSILRNDSLHQLIIDAVQIRGQKTLSPSEEILYSQAVAFLSRRKNSSDKTTADRISEDNNNDIYPLGCLDL